MCEMKYDSFFDIHNSLGDYFLKTPKPPMKIKSTRMIKVSCEFADVKVRYSYTGNWYSIQIRNLKKSHFSINLLPLYSSPVEIKPAKIKDMRELVKFTKTIEANLYYENLFSSQTRTEVEDGTEDEDELRNLDDDNWSLDEWSVDEEDCSSGEEC